MTQKRIEISKKPISRETNNFIDNWVSGNLNTNDLKNNLKRTTIYLPEDLHRNLKIKDEQYSHKVLKVLEFSF